MSVKGRIIAFLRISVDFIFFYSLISFFLFIILLLYNKYFLIPIKLSEQVFKNFLYINRYLFVGLALYASFLKNFNFNYRNNQHYNKIRFFIRSKFTSLNLYDRYFIFTTITNIFLIFGSSFILIESFFPNNAMINSQIFFLIIFILSFTLLLTPVLYDDYDSSMFNILKYIDNEEIKYLEKSMYNINRIMDDVISEKAIYTLLRFVSSCDSIGKKDHIHYLNKLVESLKSGDSKVIFESIFPLFKLSYDNDKLNITEIFVEPKFPWRTRLRLFLINNWRYIIPPSIFVVWLLNQIS